MTELDQAPATAETTSPEPAGELRSGSQDSQARYPSTVSAADKDPGYYDGDVQAALAADNTPTRQQAARDASGDDHQVAADAAARSCDAPPSERDGDIEAILHENDHLAEPRTRQQAARDEAADSRPTESTADVSRDAPDSGRDPDIEAILHENDHLAEPRTRQQAALGDATSSHAVTDKGGAATTDQQPRSGSDPLISTASEVTTTDSTHKATDNSSLSGRPDTLTIRDQAGRDVPISVIRAGPEMRTLGDDTPTGIGRKPTGEQLRDIESDDLAAFDRFRKTFYEHADDVKDAVEDTANGLHTMLERPTPTGQIEGTPHRPSIEAPVPAANAGDMVVGAMASAVLITEGIRSVRHMLERRKVHDDAGDRH